MTTADHHKPKTEYVYLITVEGEWPVSAIADCHSSTPEVVEREVIRKRNASAGGAAFSRVHVWRARLTDLTEVELVPARTVGPELRVPDPGESR